MDAGCALAARVPAGVADRRPSRRPRAGRCAGPGGHGLRRAGRSAARLRPLREPDAAARLRAVRTLPGAGDGPGLVDRAACRGCDHPARARRSVATHRAGWHARAARRDDVTRGRGRPAGVRGGAAVEARAARLHERHRGRGGREPAPQAPRLQGTCRGRLPAGPRVRPGPRLYQPRGRGSRCVVARDHSRAARADAEGAGTARGRRLGNRCIGRPSAAELRHRHGRRVAAGTAHAELARSRDPADPGTRGRRVRYRRHLADRHERAVAVVRRSFRLRRRCRRGVRLARRCEHGGGALPGLPRQRQPDQDRHQSVGGREVAAGRASLRRWSSGPCS